MQVAREAAHLFIGSSLPLSLPPPPPFPPSRLLSLSLPLSLSSTGPIQGGRLPATF